MADNRRKQRDLSATVSIWGLARKRGRISARNFSRFLPIIRSDMKMRPLRLFVTAGLEATLVCLAVPASAQYTPKPLKDPTTGESFHIEVSADIWRPNASISVQSEGLGIVGNEIDLKRDLGVVDKQMSALDLVLRPAPRHKFRFQYLPIKYEAASILNRDVVFNGIRYRANLPVNTLFDWKTYSMGYEFDFVEKKWGYVGFILEAKYTDVTVALDNPIESQFAHARGPIPALGGVGRVYLVPMVSVTAELSAFKIPDSIDNRYNAHYVDLNIYGTVNFTNNIGVKGGIRSRDVGYLIKSDSGSFVLRGPYFGAVLRY